MPSLALLIWSQSSWVFMSKSRASQTAGKSSIVELEAQQLFKHLKIIRLDCSTDCFNQHAKIVFTASENTPGSPKEPNQPQGQVSQSSLLQEGKWS